MVLKFIVRPVTCTGLGRIGGKMIKSKFLKEMKCYFSDDKIHNFTMIKLFDGRNVASCYECFNTIEIGKYVYFEKMKEANSS